jgi:hypothetical protein
MLATVTEGMSMKRSVMALFRRLIPASSLAVALIAALPAAAEAAGPIHTQFSFTNPSDSICGVSGASSGSLVDNFTPVFDSSGNIVAFSDRSRFDVIFTAINGSSVEISSSALVTAAVTLNPDDTLTFSTSYKGLPEKISTSHGAILTRDAGFITFTTTIDSSGNISQTVTQSGPHPEADANFALFCEVVTAALT